ncbi:hypothetical protein G8C92_17580 [Paenibacillus donghaensis]|uniref:hypothetical protein n=1 Tax=Paenibacillus donghaensis TaxID=414771 RepID=UPI0018836413|nr:hypothetical protein [Paenibacillus donghaensis]MBE9915828.1 hypothetical protein [Paenibacillus donghaensis]
MDLRPYKNLSIFLAANILMFGSFCVRLVLDIQLQLLPVLAWLSFLVCLGSLTGILFVGADLVTRKQDCFQGKVINKEGRIVHILTTEDRLKRLRLNQTWVRERLEADQRVEFRLTHFTKMPVSISILEPPAQKEME